MTDSQTLSEIKKTAWGILGMLAGLASLFLFLSVFTPRTTLDPATNPPSETLVQPASLVFGEAGDFLLTLRLNSENFDGTGQVNQVFDLPDTLAALEIFGGHVLLVSPGTEHNAGGGIIRHYRSRVEVLVQAAAIPLVAATLESQGQPVNYPLAANYLELPVGTDRKLEIHLKNPNSTLPKDLILQVYGQWR